MFHLAPEVIKAQQEDLVKELIANAQHTTCSQLEIETPTDISIPKTEIEFRNMILNLFQHNKSLSNAKKLTLYIDKFLFELYLEINKQLQQEAGDNSGDFLIEDQIAELSCRSTLTDAISHYIFLSNKIYLSENEMQISLEDIYHWVKEHNETLSVQQSQEISRINFGLHSTAIVDNYRVSFEEEESKADNYYEQVFAGLCQNEANNGEKSFSEQPHDDQTEACLRFESELKKLNAATEESLEGIALLLKHAKPYINRHTNPTIDRVVGRDKTGTWEKEASLAQAQGLDILKRIAQTSPQDAKSILDGWRDHPLFAENYRSPEKAYTNLWGLFTRTSTLSTAQDQIDDMLSTLHLESSRSFIST